MFTKKSYVYDLIMFREAVFYVNRILPEPYDVNKFEDGLLLGWVESNRLGCAGKVSEFNSGWYGSLRHGVVSLNTSILIIGFPMTTKDWLWKIFFMYYGDMQTAKLWIFHPPNEIIIKELSDNAKSLIVSIFHLELGDKMQLMVTKCKFNLGWHFIR